MFERIDLMGGKFLIFTWGKGAQGSIDSYAMVVAPSEPSFVRQWSHMSKGTYLLP